MLQQSDVVTVSPLVAWHPHSDDKTPGSQANSVTFERSAASLSFQCYAKMIKPVASDMRQEWVPFISLQENNKSVFPKVSIFVDFLDVN